MLQNVSWTVSTLNHSVTEELNRLPADMRARFTRVGELIEKFGLYEVGLPHVRSLGDKLWEIRANGRDGISRGIFVTVKDRQIVVLRVFVKKSQKTPRREIELALSRAKEKGLL